MFAKTDNKHKFATCSVESTVVLSGIAAKSNITVTTRRTTIINEYKYNKGHKFMTLLFISV